MIICICCKENTTEYLNHELISKDGQKIIICDTCYQDISMLEKRSNKWVEFVKINNVEYFNLVHK